MSTFAIITLIAQVLWKLLPIAREVYQMVQDPAKPDVTAENALDWIKTMANGQGLAIGDTEAELARSALHYALGKADRHAVVTGEGN
mgnify:CR=1 FL=1